MGNTFGRAEHLIISFKIEILSSWSISDLKTQKGVWCLILLLGMAKTSLINLSWAESTKHLTGMIRKWAKKRLGSFIQRLIFWAGKITGVFELTGCSMNWESVGSVTLYKSQGHLFDGFISMLVTMLAFLSCLSLMLGLYSFKWQLFGIDFLCKMFVLFGCMFGSNLLTD